MTIINQVVPVTAQQATESKIANSVKISKQLMKSELKKRMVSLKSDFETAKAETSINRKYFEIKLEEEVKRQVYTELRNDGQITRFRNLYARFSRFNSDDKNFPKFESNLDMLKDFDVEDITRCLFRSSAFDSEKKYQDFLLGKASLSVNLKIPDRPHNDDSENYNITDIDNPLGYGQTVSISQYVRDLYHKYKESNSVVEELRKKYRDVEDKLNGIDEVAEEMEAQLLVNELRQSDEGMEALKIAGDLVGNMLGDTPTLLSVLDN